MITAFKRGGDPLFGRYCRILTGYSGRYLAYRILSSGTKSNAWSETPLVYDTENKMTLHDDFEEVVIVCVDTLIDENAQLIRVARKDIEIIPEETSEQDLIIQGLKEEIEDLKEALEYYK